GLSQRDSRRAARGAADMKAAANAAAGITGPTSADQVDLSKVELPPDVVAVVEGEGDAGAAKKPALRPKRAVVKAE
ncbi:MAG: 30S ribosomal protein S2, partial [Opitutus sp.]